MERFCANLCTRLRSATARDLLITMGGNGSVAAITAFGGILAARLLGVEGRGLLAAAVVWAAVLGTAAQLGMPQALTYHVAKNQAAAGSILRAMLVIFAVQTVVVLLLGWLVVGLVLGATQPSATLGVQYYLFSVPPMMLITYLATVAQGLGKFGLFAGLRVISAVGYVFALALCYALNQRAPETVIQVLVLAQFAALVVAVAKFTLSDLPHSPVHASQPCHHWIRELLKFGLKSYGGSLSWIANARLDQFTMSSFVTLERLGQYSVAVSYAGILYPLLSAFAMVLFPRVASSGINMGIKKIYFALRLNLVTSIISVAIFALLSGWAIPALFGTEFSAATLPAVILLIGTVWLGGTYVLSDGLRGLGKPLVPTIGEIAGVAVTCVGLYILLPHLGIIGAAITSVLSYGTVFGILFLSLYRISRQPTVGHTASPES